MTVAKTNGTTAPSVITVSSSKQKVDDSKVDLLYQDEKEEIKAEDLAPDGGWGWMVALAMILVFTTTIGPTASFTIIFGDLLENTGNAGAATTLFNSVFMITFSIAGLLTNVLMKRYSMRPVGVIGAIFYALPNVALAFVTNVYQMAFIFLLQGAGLGLIVTICNTNLNAYFVKRRVQVMSVVQVIIGMGGIIYPICIDKMMKVYGFRGTAAMTGALSLNCIAGMTMMHPVEWHTKKPTEVRNDCERTHFKQERKLRNLAMSNQRSTIDVTHTASEARWSSLTSLKEENSKEIPLLVETLKTPRNRGGSVSEVIGEMRPRTRSGTMREPLTKRISALSASSLSSLVSSVSPLGDIHQLRLEQKVGQQLEEKEANGGGQDMVGGLNDLLEFSLLKNWRFLNICFGISFIFTSDFIFISLLPLMMISYGYTKSDAALEVTIGATAELVSKVLLALFTVFVNVKARYLFLIGMICMAFAKFAFMFYEDSLMGILVMNAVIGMIRSWLLVPQPLVVIEEVSIDKFAAAYGIYAVINGLVSILIGPISGFVKDWTGSFTACQLFLLGMNVLFIVPWTLQYILVDLPRVRKKRTDKRAARSFDSFGKD